MLQSPTLKSFNRSAQLFAFLLTFTAATPLLAADQKVDLKFEKQSDFERNFGEPTTKGAISVAKDDGGVLRFSSGEGPRLTRIAYAPSRKPADFVDEKVTAKFRFKKPYASFGVMSRVQKEESDCYVALVNVGPGGGILRLFKGLPRGSYADGALVTKQGPDIKPGEWYRLETSTTNKGNSVLMKAELKPGNGGRTIFAVEWEDKSTPLSQPGHVQLRFFSNEAGGEVDVKDLSIKSDAKRP